MKRILSFLLVLAMLLTITGCGKPASNVVSESDFPTADNPITIKLGHIGGPTSTLHECAAYIADKTREKTDGAINIEVYPQSQLGDAVVMLDGMTTGTVEACMVGCNEIATMIPDYYVFVLPFLFTDLDELFRVANTEEVRTKVNEISAPKGITLIGFTSGEARGLSNIKHKVDKPDDIKGLTFRIMAGSVYVDTFAALGASTSTMAFSEVYTALQQGVIDGEDNGVGMLVDMKFMEVEKNHTELRHMMQCNPFTMSTEVWNKLSPEQQGIITDIVDDWIDSYYDYYAGYMEGRLKEAIEGGVEVTKLTDDQRAVFVEATKGVYEKYAAQVDSKLYELVIDKLEKDRN